MSAKRLSATSGATLAVFVVIVWSATFVNTKALLADFWALVFMFPLLIFALAMPETARGMSCSVDLSRAGNAARFVRLPNLANLAFLGLFASAACFVAWNKACERLGTVRCSLGLYLIPVIAFLIAHVFLGETLPAAGVVGAVLVLAGVAVAGSAKSQHRQDTSCNPCRQENNTP